MGRHFAVILNILSTVTKNLSDLMRLHTNSPSDGASIYADISLPSHGSLTY